MGLSFSSEKKRKRRPRSDVSIKQSSKRCDLSVQQVRSHMPNTRQRVYVDQMVCDNDSVDDMTRKIVYTPPPRVYIPPVDESKTDESSKTEMSYMTVGSTIQRSANRSLKFDRPEIPLDDLLSSFID